MRVNDRVSSPLTATEYSIFKLIHADPQRSVTRATLVSAIWGDAARHTKTLDVHLANLRKKIVPLGLDVRFRQPDRYVLLSAVGEEKSR